jgi:ABC-type glycerol-3-phosphate transport system substrate-binding protein
MRWQFTKGKCFNDTALFCVFPSWVFNLWQSADSIKALKMVPCELPIFEHDSKYYPGFFQGVFGVMKNSPNVDNAVKLMRYMCSESVAKRWAIYTKTPTGIKTRISSSDFDQNNYDKFYNYINKKYAKTLLDFDPLVIAFGPNYNPKYASYFDQLYKVLEGEMTANEFMSLFEKI